MKLVKQLRQATGARLVDCKAAVEATAGLEEAFQWLREKGASRAAKLETRTAAHGLVAARALNGRGCLVEVNSETDFVARNAEFQRFVRDLADAALRNYSALTAPQRDAGGAALVQGDALKALDLQGTLVTDAALALSAHVGERIDVRRCALVEGAAVSAYAHNGADGAGTAAGVVVARVLFFAHFGADVVLRTGRLRWRRRRRRPAARDALRRGAAVGHRRGRAASVTTGRRACHPGSAASGLGEAGGRRGEDSQRQVKQVRPGASAADAGPRC